MTISRLHAGWLLLAGLLTTLSALASNEPPAFSALPESLFAKESTAVVFRFDPKLAKAPSPRDGRYILAQNLPEGGTRILGHLTDEGTLGDASPRDGIYGRKFQVYSKLGGEIRYQVQTETPDGKLWSSPPLSLVVVKHPAFQDLLASIWKKIQARL